MKNKERMFVNTDESVFESLIGCTIEDVELIENVPHCDIVITAYREVSGVKIYSKIMLSNSEYYVSAEYIPDSEKEEIAKKVNHDL